MELQTLWKQHWKGIGAGGDGMLLFQQLCAAYQEPHRHFHTLQHLQECFECWMGWRNEAAHPHEIGMALWFHDAILNVKRHDNEARSARWVNEALREAGCAPEVALRVRDLVIATRHDAPLQNIDAQLIMDIDLAILGASSTRFDEYTQQLRQESASVTDFIYQRRHLKNLQTYLSSMPIYHTGRARALLESRARDNITQAMAGLRQSAA